MSKDRSNKFHPKKGKPSGAHKDPNINAAALADDLHTAKENTAAADELTKDMKILHPNRTTGKSNAKTEKSKAEENRVIKSKIEVNKAGGLSPIANTALSARLNKESFASLANVRSDTCISIYLPSHNNGMEVNERVDAIGFKNAVQQIEKELQDNKMEQDAIHRLLEPCYRLLTDEKFWNNLSKGLAVFITDKSFQYILLPFPPPVKTIINRRFYLLPLVEIAGREEYFYLLVISKRQVQLFRADLFGITNVPVPDLPEGIDDVVHFEEKDDQKLFKTGGASAGKGANFHGIGAGKPDEKKNISLYLKEVNNTLWKEVLHNETAPLLIAAVDYIIPLYRKANTYNHLWPEVIVHGGAEHESLPTLYNLAMTKMNSYFTQRRAASLKNYGDASASMLTTSLPTRIIPAAHYGRIADLFVLKDAHTWGTFDEASDTLYMHSHREQGDECLVDQSAIKTILHNGNVFLLEKNEMPEESNMAALLRY